MDQRIGDLSLPAAHEIALRPGSRPSVPVATLRRVTGALIVFAAGLAVLSPTLFQAQPGARVELAVLVAALLFERLCLTLRVYSARHVGNGFRLFLALGVVNLAVGIGFALLLLGSPEQGLFQPSADLSALAGALMEPGFNEATALLLWAALASMGVAGAHLIVPVFAATLVQPAQAARDIAVAGSEETLRVLAQHHPDRLTDARAIHALVPKGESPPFSGAVFHHDADAFVEHLRGNPVSMVIVGADPAELTQWLPVMRKLQALPVDLRLFMIPPDLRASRCPVNLIPLSRRPLGWTQGLMKRALDIGLSGLALLALGPVLLAIAALIRLDSPGPVFFRQPRQGYNGSQFRIFKFRTMYTGSGDVRGAQLTRRDDPRVTRLGAFLRRTSLDELPQLLNVLLGDMSLVGPRPHPLEAKVANTPYAEVVEAYGLRWRMKPGMTGWAQVNGWRGPTEIPVQLINRVRYDLEYIENWSVAFDLFILWRTIVVCVGGKNAF